jgi:hypothetical protein
MSISEANRTSENDLIINSIKIWVEKMVVGLNLCPFAKKEVIRNRVRYVNSTATTQEQLLMNIKSELELLNDDKSIETTLLIHPKTLDDFYDYNEFLAYADDLLVDMDLDGTYQIASFHPDYQFGGTAINDAENFTNRSPYPMLHLIREESLEQAVANYPNIDKVPTRNIELMKKIGTEKLQEIIKSMK